MGIWYDKFGWALVIAFAAFAAQAQAPTPEEVAALVAERSQHLVGQELSKGMRVISVQAEESMVVRRDAVVDFELLETLIAAPQALEEIAAPHYRQETCANPIAKVLIEGGVFYRLLIEDAAGSALVQLDVTECEEG